MEISDLITPESIFEKLPVTSKKQALQELAKRAAEISAINERVIFDALIERERLGTTGVGNGIAIPHGKLAGLERLYGLFARLESRSSSIQSMNNPQISFRFARTCRADHLKALARVAPSSRSRHGRNSAVLMIQPHSMCYEKPLHDAAA